ncbi:hypothetical protein, partial [Streptobacillus moniliformis]|uniref:hypothetical protein n=1 Tax=Streptobacillus moniliformis TaxID=34105 RepID=UPI000AF55CC6
MKATILDIVRELYKIIENNLKNYNLKTYIINFLTYKISIIVRTIIKKVRKTFNTSELFSIISYVLKLKNSYTEYDFYKNTRVILYFMELDKASDNINKPIKEEILEIIEKEYFMHSSCKKILKDVGIYDKDIDIISKIIGENSSSVDELQI